MHDVSVRVLFEYADNNTVNNLIAPDPTFGGRGEIATTALDVLLCVPGLGPATRRGRRSDGLSSSVLRQPLVVGSRATRDPEVHKKTPNRRSVACMDTTRLANCVGSLYSGTVPSHGFETGTPNKRHCLTSNNTSGLLEVVVRNTTTTVREVGCLHEAFLRPAVGFTSTTSTST